MAFKKPTRKDAMLKLISAIKLCISTFADDYPNFCEMLTEWENSLKQRIKSMGKKS
ncbi:MAG: hypothetical protein ACI4JK_05270 [Oscillospiraceae bacterium]